MSASDKFVTFCIGLSSAYNFYDGSTIAGIVLAIITALIIGFYGGRDSMKNHDYKNSDDY
jgi:hypothetical protein